MEYGTPTESDEAVGPILSVHLQFLGLIDSRLIHILSRHILQGLNFIPLRFLIESGTRNRSCLSILHSQSILMEADKVPKITERELWQLIVLSLRH